MSNLEKLPVTIVTGFLGSGKTTLIRHLMTNPQGKRLVRSRQFHHVHQVPA